MHSNLSHVWDQACVLLGALLAPLVVPALLPIVSSEFSVPSWVCGVIGLAIGSVVALSFNPFAQVKGSFRESVAWLREQELATKRA